MVLNKEERLKVGKQIYERHLSVSDVMEEYHVSRSTAEGWLTQYKRSAGLLPEKQKAMPPERYGELTREELMEELMRKDIEIERLKKGYTVKGVGAQKEYVTIKDANTK